MCDLSSYGFQGQEIICKTITRLYSRSTSITKLDEHTAAPLPVDVFLLRVLVPEVAIRLIAEDLGILPDDPRARETVEKSREYGLAIFSDDDEIYNLGQALFGDGSGQDPLNEVNHVAVTSCSPAFTQIEARYLEQLPAKLKRFIVSIFDPPARGNCGFLAVANALGYSGKDSHIRVRVALEQELMLHREDHEGFLQQNPDYLKTVEKPQASEVEGLLHRLSCKTEACTSEFYMKMPDLGYAIASAFERAVVHLTRLPQNCCTFLPYRIRPNLVDPIVLLFVDNIHFVLLNINKDFPFPEIYRTGYAQSTSRPVGRWMKSYSLHFARWKDLYSAQVFDNTEAQVVED